MLLFCIFTHFRPSLINILTFNTGTIPIPVQMYATFHLWEVHRPFSQHGRYIASCPLSHSLYSTKEFNRQTSAAYNVCYTSVLLWYPYAMYNVTSPMTCLGIKMEQNLPGLHFFVIGTAGIGSNRYCHSTANTLHDVRVSVTFTAVQTPYTTSKCLWLSQQCKHLTRRPSVCDFHSTANTLHDVRVSDFHSTANTLHDGGKVTFGKYVMYR